MTKDEIEELAAGCEHASRILWLSARDPEHSWDRKTCLRVAQGMARAARELREYACEVA